MNVRRFIRTMRRREKLRSRTSADVRSENQIGIVEIGNDEIEARKKIAERRGESASARKETRQRPGLDRTHFVSAAGEFGQAGDVQIAEHFETRFRKVLSQCSNRGQRENEITNRSAADDE